jgi:hypothetical protein
MTWRPVDEFLALAGFGSLGMNSQVAEWIIVAIVLVWLVSVVAAVIDPERSEIAVSMAPVISAVATGAIGVLLIARKRNGNGAS